MSGAAIQQYDIPERADKLAVFDADYLTTIQTHLTHWSSTRIILVASHTLASTTTLVSDLQTLLGPRLLATKLGIGPHSPYPDVLALSHLLQHHKADALISLGSGSYSDAAKIAVLAAATFPPHFTASDLEGRIDPSRGCGVLEPATARLVLVPTSLSAGEWNGTGSCTNAAGKKQHFGREEGYLAGGADLIVLDPRVGVTAPERLWLSSGVRCIDHCVETVCDLKVGEEAVRDALEGLKGMIKGLSEYHEAKGGGKVDERELLRGVSDAQKGSRQAIKGLLVHGSTFGPSHAIGHQLGSVGGVMHGLNSCILLGPVLRYTKKEKKERQARVLNCFNETLGWHEADAADSFVRFVKMLGLPTTMTEVGVTDEKKIQQVAVKTLTDIWGGGKPQLTTKEQVMEILDMAR